MTEKDENSLSRKSHLGHGNLNAIINFCFISLVEIQLISEISVQIHKIIFVFIAELFAKEMENSLNAY